MLGRQLGEVPVGDERYVFWTLSQRDRLNHHHVQAVKEVLTEAALIHFGLQRAVRGSQHPHVDGDFFMTANGHDGSLLQHTQQLGLNLRLHLPDFVEEDRAAVRRPETPQRRRNRASERALHVAKHVAGEERACRYRTIDRNKGFFRLRPIGVDRAGDQFLASATRAENEHIGGVFGNPREILPQLTGPSRHPDNFVECDPPAIRSRLARHRNAFRRVPHFILFSIA